MIIALSGKRRSGKDTLASALETKHGFHPVKISSRMKECVKEYYALTDAHIEGDLKEVALDVVRMFVPERPHFEEMAILATVHQHASDLIRKGESSVTPRQLMIWAGNLGRETSLPGLHNRDSLFWFNRFFDTKLENYHEKNYVITDMRYPEELKALGQNMWVFTVRVNRPLDQRGFQADDPLERSIDNTALDGIGVDGWYAVIENDSSVEALEAKADELVKHLFQTLETKVA